MKIKEKENLAVHSSWLVGGPADYFCEPESVENLIGAVRFASEKKIPFTVLGGGTNVLISDKGVRGIVVSLSKLTGVEDIRSENGKFFFWCLAGTAKSEL